jgi:hypothetical protein
MDAGLRRLGEHPRPVVGHGRRGLSVEGERCSPQTVVPYWQRVSQCAPGASRGTAEGRLGPPKLSMRPEECALRIPYTRPDGRSYGVGRWAVETLPQSPPAPLPRPGRLPPTRDGAFSRSRRRSE